MSNTTKSKAATLALVQALIAGTQKHIPTSSFTLRGATYTAATLVPLLQELVNAILAVNAAQHSATDTVAAMVAIEAKVGPVVTDYKRFVQLSYANATQTLADFGVTAPKARAPRTVEQKAAAKAKAEATRKARGTSSKKQKLQVKGNVTGVTVTPNTAPAAALPDAPAPPVTPASPAAQPAPAASTVPTPGPATK